MLITIVHNFFYTWQLVYFIHINDLICLQIYIATVFGAAYHKNILFIAECEEFRLLTWSCIPIFNKIFKLLGPEVKWKNAINFGKIQNWTVICALVFKMKHHTDLFEFFNIFNNNSGIKLPLRLSKFIKFFSLRSYINKKLVSLLLISHKIFPTNKCQIHFVLAFLHCYHLIWFSSFCFEKRNIYVSFQLVVLGAEDLNLINIRKQKLVIFFQF